MKAKTYLRKTCEEINITHWTMKKIINVRFRHSEVPASNNAILCIPLHKNVKMRISKTLIHFLTIISCKWNKMTRIFEHFECSVWLFFGNIQDFTRTDVIVNDSWTCVFRRMCLRYVPRICVFDIDGVHLDRELHIYHDNEFYVLPRSLFCLWPFSVLTVYHT